MFAGFVTGNLNLRNTGDAIIKGAAVTGAVIIILLFIFVMTRAMVLEQIPKQIALWLTGISDNKIMLLLMINVILLIIGMVVDDASGSILAAIVLLPVATSIGVHPIHFAAIVGVNIAAGNITPPLCTPPVPGGSRRQLDPAGNAGADAEIPGCRLSAGDPPCNLHSRPGAVPSPGPSGNRLIEGGGNPSAGVGWINGLGQVLGLAEEFLRCCKSPKHELVISGMLPGPSPSLAAKDSNENEPVCSPNRNHPHSCSPPHDLSGSPGHARES